MSKLNKTYENFNYFDNQLKQLIFNIFEKGLGNNLDDVRLMLNGDLCGNEFKIYKSLKGNTCLDKTARKLYEASMLANEFFDKYQLNINDVVDYIKSKDTDDLLICLPYYPTDLSAVILWNFVFSYTKDEIDYRQIIKEYNSRQLMNLSYEFEKRKDDSGLLKFAKDSIITMRKYFCGMNNEEELHTLTIEYKEA